jgi:hypothetical protein
MKKAVCSPLAFVVTFVWFGFVSAISFMEAPVKFTAPSLTLAVGLDVGRHVFAVLNKAEIGFTLVSLLLLVRGGWPVRIACLLTGLAGIVALQTLWLLPALDVRALVYIGGGTPPPSQLHLLYVALEAAKVIGLLVLGTWQVNHFQRTLTRQEKEPAWTA